MLNLLAQTIPLTLHLHLHDPRPLKFSIQSRLFKIYLSYYIKLNYIYKNLTNNPSFEINLIILLELVQNPYKKDKQEH